MTNRTAPQIKINSGLFYVAYLFASTEETRYYLDGVYIEPHPEGGVTLTATNGHYLIQILDRGGSTDRPFIMSMNKRDLTKLKPTRRTPNETLITYGTELGFGRFRVDLAAIDSLPKACFFAVEVDGTYPDYRKVIPWLHKDRKPCGEVSLDAKYIGNFGAASLLIGYSLGIDVGSGISLAMAATSHEPMLISLGPAHSAFGVIMPMRTECTAEPPIWYVREKVSEQVAA